MDEKINIPCSVLWNMIKDEKITKKLDDKAKEALALSLGLNVKFSYNLLKNNSKLVLNIGKDIKKICPGSVSNDVVLKLFDMGFDDIICDVVKKYLTKTNLSEKLKYKIIELCPYIIEQCGSTICKNDDNTFSLNCKDIEEIFYLILEEPEIIKKLPPDIVIDKNNVCKIIRFIYNLGIDFSKIIYSFSKTKLDYNSILNCVCPDLDIPLNCKEISIIINDFLNNKKSQEFIEKNIGFSMNSENKCQVLQNIVNETEKHPSIFIHKILKEELEKTPEYIPKLEKLKYIIDCICPHLSINEDIHDNGNDQTEKQENNQKHKNVYRKINITVLIFTSIILTIILSKFYNTKIVIITSLILLILLLIINPYCLFKTCISGGKDWKRIEGNFKGSKSMFGITININVNIHKDNSIKINTLTCDGEHCPFKTLSKECFDSKNTIQTKNKYNFGYKIEGKCIDELYNIKKGDNKIIKGIWISQENKRKIHFTISILTKVLGVILISTPLNKL